jgi:hypothetical protein
VDHIPPAVNGTEARLDALIDEVRALRDDLARRGAPPPDGQIELREPAATGAPESPPAPRAKQGRR